MKQSHLFTKTRKEAPKDEVSKNAELLIRGGFIHKEMAGVYSFLPLGLRVLNKVVGIIREEMNKIGGQELALTAIQDKELWEKTGRWSDEVVDSWFKTKLKNGTDVGLGITHEEPLTNLMREHISSYRDLPIFAYQFQTKFRNETRAKSGIVRGREFLMKDLYSFSKDQDEHQRFYDGCRDAYMEIFKRAGIGDKTYVTYASGGIFSKYSDEFQTVSEAGEDIIYVCDKCNRAINEEIAGDAPKCAVCGSTELRKEKAIEVGNIFSLGTKFSEPLGLEYLDAQGEKKLVVMGSYGIGPGRLMGTIVEVLSDEKGIVWPTTVSPFNVHLVEIASENPEVKKWAEHIYKELSKTVEVLYDDRDRRAGEKFADSDLIGIPYRLVISEKNLNEKMIEVKERKSSNVEMIGENELLRGEWKKFTE